MAGPRWLDSRSFCLTMASTPARSWCRARCRSTAVKTVILPSPGKACCGSVNCRVRSSGGSTQVKASRFDVLYRSRRGPSSVPLRSEMFCGIGGCNRSCDSGCLTVERQNISDRESVNTVRPAIALRAWQVLAALSMGSCRKATALAQGSGRGGGDAPNLSLANECATRHVGWIWCDDFEQDRLSRYFEYDSAGGSFVRAAVVGVGGSYGMRARFARAQVSAGALHLAMGEGPSGYFRAGGAGAALYREGDWRVCRRGRARGGGGGGARR